jgi:hypothetical protein
VASGTIDLRVHPPRDRDGKALGTLFERSIVIGLDNEMQVVRLDRVMNDSERGIAPRCAPAEDQEEHGAELETSQPGRALHDLHGHMDRMARVVRAARAMRHARLAQDPGLPSGALAPATST